MNAENLIPLNKRSEEERREIARLGGIASGEVRRRKAVSRAYYRHYAHEYLIKEKICAEEVEEYNAFIRHRRYLKQKKKLKEQAESVQESNLPHKRTQYECEKNAQIRDLVNRITFNGKSLSQAMSAHGIKY